MRRAGAIVAALMLATGTPAAADYVFDPKDLPADFVCNPDRSVVDCAEERRVEAWASIYGERNYAWLASLVFDVNLYFADPVPRSHRTAADDVWIPPEDRRDHATPNLVDAHYTVALLRYDGWAFAIDREARMRMVRRKDERELEDADIAKLVSWLPTSPAEAAELIPHLYAFEEADLTTCPGGLAQLRAFPMQRGAPLWNERELDWVAGKSEPKSDAIIVTADGDGVFLRARGVPDRGRPVMRFIDGPVVIYDQRNGGEGYDWAKAMAEIARPCLKPSTATPPWEKLLAAEG
ncbi:hypothetical protein [Porphyrobacter sp. YT40]|uniref:hypothetical protein n=1 Tax=Porphyrobacter sp. YT40 TaxID=2547601 RepID=UPI0011414A77|nr:hypothetical protein [Porphyrobacter sp. YT40]QDH33394.1 hypothetical protein E2E27_03005 [Porphyrobacter sp. YT40]